MAATAAPPPPRLHQLPEEMFIIIKSAARGTTSPRLGRMALAGRNALDTPNYLANTSRGVVPHLTPDTFARDATIGGVYMALEDFIEHAPQKSPPLYEFAKSLLIHNNTTDSNSSSIVSALRRYVALQESALLVLGARRTPPIAAPEANSNTNSAIAICTSVGFKPLRAEDYASAVEGLRPDISVALGDVPFGRALGSKRIEKATERSSQWMQDHINLRRSSSEGSAAQSKLFAPVLPLSCAHQRFYLDFVIQEREEISGLALYDTISLQDIPDTLQDLPRLAFTQPTTPHDILHHIRLGIDLLTVPFIDAATDAGIALDFTFPAPTATTPTTIPQALGVDMWSSDHATVVAPLIENCQCHACTVHHRAYIHHLLQAKEMLGWVLLQIHNHHILEQFFAGVRQSIARDTFDKDIDSFARIYEPLLPEKTGRGPRVRGYQFKSEGPGETKRNPAPFNTLDDTKEKLAEGVVLGPRVNGEILEQQGFAEKKI